MHLQNNCFLSSWWAFLLHSNSAVPGPAWCQIKKQYLLSEMIGDLICFKLQTRVAHFDAWVEEFVNVLIWTEKEIHGRRRSPENIKLNRAHQQRSRREQHSLLFLLSPHFMNSRMMNQEGRCYEYAPFADCNLFECQKEYVSYKYLINFHNSHIL